MSQTITAVFRLFLFTLFLFTAFSADAQPYSWMRKPKPYKFMLGAGLNFIDDDGRDFCQPFDVNQSWNYKLYPTRLVFDTYLKKGMSLEFAGAYTEYSADKLVNDSTGRSGIFISVDANFKYSFYNLFSSISWFDPYVSLGIGGTHREAYDPVFNFNFNAALGVNFWIYRGFGLQLQTAGKFGIKSDFYATDADYLQHTVSLMYKFGERKQMNRFNNKKRYKYIHKKVRYKGRQGR